jgi:hypothetical protein
MQSGVDGWKPEPPPVEFVPFVALNQSPEAKSDSVIWRETLRGGTIFCALHARKTTTSRRLPGELP